MRRAIHMKQGENRDNFTNKYQKRIHVTSFSLSWHLVPCFSPEPAEDSVGLRLSFNIEILKRKKRKISTFVLFCRSPIVWVARRRNIWHSCWNYRILVTIWVKIDYDYDETWLESTRVARSRAVHPDLALTVGSAPDSSNTVTTSV